MSSMTPVPTEANVAPGTPVPTEAKLARGTPVPGGDRAC